MENAHVTRQTKPEPVVVPLRAQSNARADEIIARKGNFIIRRTTANNISTQSNIAGTVGRGSAAKAVLLNTKSNALALLSPNIIVGVKDIDIAQAQAIATRYKITLVKTLASGRMAIYRAPLDDVLSVTTDIRANEAVNFANADIVENFAAPQ